MKMEHTEAALVSAYSIARGKVLLNYLALDDPNEYTSKFLTEDEIELTKLSCEIFKTSKTYSRLKDFADRGDYNLFKNENKLVTDKQNRINELVYLTRSKYAKDIAEENLNGHNDIRQAFEIGHGYDFSFIDLALKNPDKQFYFVDLHLVSEIYKKSIEIFCEDKKIEFPKNIKIVSCDLEQENLLEKLTKTGADISARSYINMQGLASHLQPETFKNLLNSISKNFDENSLLNFTILNSSKGSCINTMSRDEILEVLEKSGFDTVSKVGYGTIVSSELKKAVINEKPQTELDGLSFFCSVREKETAILKTTANTNLEEQKDYIYKLPLPTQAVSNSASL